jgi:AraC-like DNA-binding protein
VDAWSKILSIVVSAGIVQGLFLALAALRASSGRRRGGFLPAAIVLLFTLNIAVPEFLGGAGAFPLHGYFLFMGAFPLCLGPLLLLYARELGGRPPRASDALHALPLLAYLACLAALSRAPMGFLSASAAQRLAGIAWIGILVHAVAYLGRVILMLHGLSSRLKQGYSSLERRNYSWIRFFAAAFLLAYAAMAFSLLTLSHGKPFLPADKSASLILSLLVFAFGWRGFFQESPQVITAADGNGPAASGTSEARGKADRYARSGISEAKASEILARVRALMEEEKPFLDPDLSLASLAGEAGLAPGELSRVINGAAGANFYDFVNAYRVEEAKRALSDPAHDARSVLDIAYGAGFRSKSTFNQCFRAATGITPLEFRRKRPPA